MKLALGTAQFGLDYGITNTSGKMDVSTCNDILSVANDAGVFLLDTAAAYGSSEETLGKLKKSKVFSIVSKIPALQLHSPLKIIESVNSTLLKLNQSSIYGLLIHSEDDLLGEFSEQYYQQLVHLKEKNKVKKIGVSFYSIESAINIINRYDIDLIQIPASHLDRRFEHGGVLELAKSKGIEVHVRSLFLQGLLVVNADDRPKAFQLYPELVAYDQQAKKLKLTHLQLALLYLINTPLIDVAVIGCQSSEQLKQIIDAYNSCKLLNIQIPDLSTENIKLINPVNW